MPPLGLRSLALALAVLTGPFAAGAQAVTVAPSVDTGSRTGRELLALWRAYLHDRADSARARSYWSAADRARWPSVDLTAPWVQPDPGTPPPAATIVEIAPDVPGDTTTWVVRTLFADADPRGGVRPVALTRVYAVREDGLGRWVLTNALSRLTSGWTRARVGRIDFVLPPGRKLDSALAARSARFVDSAAAAVGVAPPATVSYYMVGAPRELARVLGLDWAPNGGGRLYAENALLLAGSPGTKEWNPHDLAHVVLDPIAHRAPRPLIEGAGTWLGGWRNRDYRTLVRGLNADLEHHPAWTLDTILAPHTWKDTVSYPALAVLADLAFSRHGKAGLVALLAPSDGSPDAIRRSAAAAIGIPEAEVAVLWRRRIRELAGER